MNAGTHDTSRRGPLKWAALAAALLIAFVIFLVDTVTPTALPVDAPASEFSATRAMADIRAIASVPHVLGSPANDLGRDHLLARMRALGLSPQVQRGSSFEFYETTIYGGTAENVIGVLPGRNRSAPALALMAHRDSVPGSPGAADDAAGVASALEIARAIKSHGTPERDVVLVITDGEEAGLLGARVFFDESPLAAHVGYVINMEARGGGGRAAMFETGPGNGGDIDLLRRTARQPDSNALTVFVYQHMPNDTDFTVARQHGKVGLNYAFIGGQFDYHSPSSTPDVLDVGSVQHMGAEVLPTAMALAFGPLPPRAPDVVYGNLVLGLMPAYPTGYGWGVLAAAALLIAFGALQARRRQAFVGIDVARGVGAALYLIAASGAVLEFTRRATGVGTGWMPYRPLLARFTTFEFMMLAATLGTVLFVAGVAGRGRGRVVAGGLSVVAGLGASLFSGFDLVGLVLAVVGAIAGGLSFGAPVRVAGSWTGLLATTLVAAIALQLLAPTAAYVLAWPLLAVALASGLTAAGTDRSVRALLVTFVIVLLTLAWLGELFHTLLQGLDLPALIVLPTWLAALAMWPLVVPDETESGAVRPGVAAIALALVVAAYLHLSVPWTPRYPDAVEPVLVVEPATSRTWRASLLAPDAWTRDVLVAEGGGLVKLPLDFEDMPVDAAVAAPVDAQPAPASLTIGAGRQVTLVVGVRPGTSSTIVTLHAPTAIDHVTVDGKPARLAARNGKPVYELAAGEKGRLVWAGPQGFTLGFHTDDPEKLVVHTAQFHDRWMAAKPLPAMPSTDQAWDRAGSTIVVGTVVAK